MSTTLCRRKPAAPYKQSSLLIDVSSDQPDLGGRSSIEFFIISIKNRPILIRAEMLSNA